MKKIIVASLLLSALSFGVSEFLARKSLDMKRIGAGLPTGPLVIPELPDPSLPQKEVDELDPNPNSELLVVGSTPRLKRRETDDIGAGGIPGKGFVPSLSAPTELGPVDPYRREQLGMARVYDAVGPKFRHGTWLFPLLGIVFIVWRKMEEIRIRRLMETIAQEEAVQRTSDAKEVPGVPAPPA